MGRAARFAISGLLPALLLGCQKHERSPGYGGSAEDGGDVLPMETPAFGGGGSAREDERGVVPAAVGDFERLVEGLDEAAPDPRHAALVRALDGMAAAFQAMPDLPAEARASVHEIRNEAQRIETSGAESMKRAEWARQALLEAADALDAMRRADAALERLSGYAEDVREAAGKLVLDEPLLGQEQVVADALEEVAEALTWSARQGGDAATGAQRTRVSPPRAPSAWATTTPRPAARRAARAGEEAPASLRRRRGLPFPQEGGP